MEDYEDANLWGNLTCEVVENTVFQPIERPINVITVKEESDNVTKNSVMELLECPICNECYDNEERRPRSLACGHTFCTFCLDNAILNVTLTCPNCREVSFVPYASSLPTNYTVLGLVGSIGELSKNILSEKSQPSPIPNILSPALTAGVCEEHGNHLLFLCQSCRVWICRDCTVLNHPMEKDKCRVISIRKALKSKQEQDKSKIKVDLINFEQDMTSLLNYRIQLIEFKDAAAACIEMAESQLELVERTIPSGQQQKGDLKDMADTIAKTSTLNELKSAQKKYRELRIRVKQWSIEMEKQIPSERAKATYSKLLTKQKVLALKKSRN